MTAPLEVDINRPPCADDPEPEPPLEARLEAALRARGRTPRGGRRRPWRVHLPGLDTTTTFAGLEAARARIEELLAGGWTEAHLSNADAGRTRRIAFGHDHPAGQLEELRQDQAGEWEWAPVETY